MNKSKMMMGFASGLLLGQAALAEVPDATTQRVGEVTTQVIVGERMPLVLDRPSSAVYRDKVITIPHGAVFDEAGVTHYRDIQLVEVAEGTFQVADAQPGRLAEVDSVDILIDQASGEVEVVIEGAQSSACVTILDPIVSVKGNEIDVVLAESKPEGDVCIMMLVFYKQSFTLQAGELEPGNYKVVVNGVEAGFSL